ncbi:MAG: ornithine carbamoyltransferase [Bacilli bacterium]|jgi:ornithine carbamoyltransferase|nr:ornithine carbamoyltransferase [Bacilli bacterium]
MPYNGRSLLTWLDYSSEDFAYFLQLSQQLKKEKQQGITHQHHVGKQIVLLFQKDSTRTRSAFEVAAHDLGMNVTYVGSSGSQMGVKESIKDTARVLGRMYQGIEFRGYFHSDAELLAKYSGVPVWNGLTDEFHPTQVLADLLTIYESFGHLSGITLAYVGDARNNVANSLMVGCAKAGLNYRAVAPKELWPDDTLLKTCREVAKLTGARIELFDDVDQGVRDADAIYTDVWVSMGEPKEVWAKRIALLYNYQVNAELMKKASKNAIFLHCLPAFHGLDTEVGRQIATDFGKDYPRLRQGELEVTNEVFESKQSRVFDQAENRMHTIKAIMMATL